LSANAVLNQHTVMEEKTVWKGSSSQVIFLGTYVLCVLFCWLIVPIFIFIWKWMENRSRVYEVTTQRIKVTRGVFNKRTDELELYRVRDTSLVEPFRYRIFGAGNIELTTMDASTPGLTIEAIKGASDVREEIRRNVEACRDHKGVRVTEFE
jgi:uncharacterized membrane protein YdbT with pleckstrin-like domain